MEYTEIDGENSRYITRNLSRSMVYAEIDVQGFGFLSELPAVDEEGTLYYIFKDDDLKLAQLTPSGGSEILTLGSPSDYKALWLEDRLFLEFSQPSGAEYFTFQPQNGFQKLPIEFPVPEGYEYVPFNYEPDLDGEGGLIRLLSRPYRDKGSDYAMYQLIDLEQGSYSDYRFPLPSSTIEAIPGQIAEGEKALLVVYGINHAEKQALVCYYEGQANGTERSYLGVWDSEQSEMLWRKEDCCMNTEFFFFRDYIYQNCVSEYCTGSGIFTWADAEPAVPYQALLNSRDGNYIRFVPFENGWLIGTETRVLVVDEHGKLVDSFELAPGNYHWSYRLAQPLRQ